MALLKLFQEPDIVLEEQPDVVELVHQRAHAVDSEAKREPGILLWIDADRAQHVWMHHAGTAQLDPARVLTDATTTSLALEATEIKLGARLRKRKVGWAKARDRVRPEHSPQKLSHRAFQVRHRDAAVDAQSFDLKEHRIVRGIGSIATKYTSGRDHSDGRAATLHCMNLHR